MREFYELSTVSFNQRARRQWKLFGGEQWKKKVISSMERGAQELILTKLASL